MIALAGALAGLLPLASRAAEDEGGEPAAASPATGGTQGIEEIIVTAQKREASIQDVPISMTALGGDDAEFRGIRDLFDLERQVPNLDVGEREGSSTVTIRGVGLNVEFGNIEGSAAVHIDGHFQPRVTSGILGLNDLERVEVLRGPQGTLYGRNATAGALNFILKKPTDELEGSLRVGYGSFDTKSFFGVVSGPLIDGLLNARLYGEYDETEGFIRNLTLDRNVGDRDGFGGRLALSFFPLDGLTADFSILTRKDHVAPVVVLADPPDPDLEAGLTMIPPTSPDQYVLGDFYTIKEQRKERGHKETTDATTTLTWSTPYATVKSITGVQYHYLHFDYDADATERPTFHFNGRRDRSLSLSQEVNITHTLEGPFGTRLDWLLGAFYFDDRYHTFIPVDLDTAAAGLGLLLFDEATQDDHAYAGFGDATLWLTSWLRVFGGIRQSFEDKEVLQNFRAFAKPGMVEVPGVLIPPAIGGLLGVSLCRDLRLSTSFDNLSPRYGAQVDVWDGVMLYGQRSLGFKAGGANSTACNNVYAPEDVDTKELGVKSRWLDGGLTANFAFFTNDFTNFQVLKTTGLTAPIINAKGASIDGAELELHSRPFAGWSSPLAPLVLDVTAAWLRARYDEFRDTDPSNPDAGVQDLEGNHLNRAPDYTINVGVEYEWPIPISHLRTLRIRGEWFRTDDIWYRPYGGRDDIQPGYSLWNAYASVSDATGHAELRLIGKNLADQGYYSMITATQIGNHYAQPGAPRSIGAELVLRF